MENFHAQAYLRTLIEASNNVQHLVIETKKNPVTAHENISAATAVACMTLSDLVESSGLKQFVTEAVQTAAQGVNIPGPVNNEAAWRAFLKWQRLSMLDDGLDEVVVDDVISRHWECYEQPVADVLLTRMRELREIACHSSFISKGHLGDVDAIRFIDRIGLGLLGVCTITGAGYVGLTDPFLGPAMAPPAMWLGAGMMKKCSAGFKTQ